MGLQDTPIASLHRDKNPPTSVLDYYTKQSDGEAPVMLELWGMQSTSLFPLLPDPHWSGVVVPDRVLSMGQIELKCVLVQN